MASGARGLALRNLLIVGEIALALVLLTAGGLMLKSVVRLQATEVGFNPDGLLTVRVALPGPQYNAQRATQFLADAGRTAGRPRRHRRGRLWQLRPGIRRVQRDDRHVSGPAAGAARRRTRWSAFSGHRHGTSTRSASG